MKEDWKECKLGDCVSILGDGLHGTPKYTHNGEYAFINGNNLVNGKIIIKPETKRVNNEEYLKYKKNLNDRTIFVSINGTIGNVGTYNGEKIILGKSACYFNVLDNIDKTFIKYIVSSPLFKIYLETNATGTTIKNVSLAQMRNYSFYLPPLATQQKIATILSSLDDKIELNNKINDNLEQQAQAIFKSWFVDFEPFGGKMPEGWKVGKLSDLITVKYGKDHKKLNDGNYPVYGSGGTMRYVEKFLYDKESVLIPRKGTLNNVFYINEPFWSVDTMFYTEMKKENITKYVYFFVKGKDLNSMNAGSAVPSMTTEILNAIEVVIPSDEYLEKFENIVSPMFKQIKQCIIENENLASVRDTLLPKLMNGEIEVDEVKV